MSDRLEFILAISFPVIAVSLVLIAHNVEKILRHLKGRE